MEHYSQQVARSNRALLKNRRTIYTHFKDIYPASTHNKQDKRHLDLRSLSPEELLQREQLLRSYRNSETRKHRVRLGLMIVAVVLIVLYLLFR